MGVLEDTEVRLESIEVRLADLAGRQQPPDPEPIARTLTWLDPKQASNHVGLSHQALALYRSKGTGPAFTKVGGVIRYSREDLDAWMRDNRRDRDAQGVTQRRLLPSTPGNLQGMQAGRPNILYVEK